MSAAAGSATGKLPFVVRVLTAGTFLTGTTEFVLAGARIWLVLAGDTLKWT
ncbi:hypothetical protein [Streptomyces sp. HM190]|uniref:hypothetical protein n=1 Tax=Streptomyces sp. HM190 TaxID=2695266 RepID=UPI00135AB59A|nr:hypothetical protein [Streptomyces sp. HM190]